MDWISLLFSSCLPPCRGEGVPVHQDPVHGIVTNSGNENGYDSWEHGELGPRRFSGYGPIWYIPKRKYLYKMWIYLSFSVSRTLTYVSHRCYELQTWSRDEKIRSPARVRSRGQKSDLDLEKRNLRNRIYIN